MGDSSLHDGALASADRWIEISLAVEHQHDGYRLDRFLAARIRRLSRTRIQSIISAGQVSVMRGAWVRAASRVYRGDVVVVRRPPLAEPEVPRVLSVIHQDADLLVLDKPAGLPVHPSARYHRHTLTAVLRDVLGVGHGWEMAHRLDRETSGVMVFGRRGASASALKRAFAHRHVSKEYLALVHGELRAHQAIDLALGPAKNSRVRIKMGPRELADGGLPAQTEVAPLSWGLFRGAPITLVRVRPRTGRQHQIRVHLAEIGHGVLGDKLYGIDEQGFVDVADHGRLMADFEAELGLSRQALHAAVLELPHPRHGRAVRFEAPWPAELGAILAVRSARDTLEG